MLKRFLTLLCLAAACTGARAQYFGTPLFTEGFDSETFPSAWTQANATAGNPDQWTLSSGDVAGFSGIVADNKHSAKISVTAKDTKLTLTSPTIDATGKRDIQVGFYGYELTYAFRGGVDFRFRASHDGGATWTDLFASASGSSYAGTPAGQWSLYKYDLPEEFNGKQIVLQFYIDSSTMINNPQGLNGYIDGVFVSLLPECDPSLTSINYSTDDRRPTSGIFSNAEPLTVTIHNGGSHELTSAELYYSINGGEETVETYTFPTALAKGADIEYSFAKGIDLSATGKTMVITAGVRIEGDQDQSNNEVKAYAENLVAEVPYVPAFVYQEDGVTVTSRDGWTTFENNMEYGWDFLTWGTPCWYVEPEMNDDPNDAYLVSRPIRMHAGTSYRLQFSAVTEDVWSDSNNIMRVVVGTDPEMTGNLKEIWRDDAIKETNAMNASALFTVEEDGIYYIGFHSLSEAGADVMRLMDVGLYKNVDKDVALSAVLSPAPAAYTFTAAEPVKIRVANYGATTLTPGMAKIKITLDGVTALEESIDATIEPNASVDYQLKSTLDLSDLGHVYDAVAEVSIDGDEDMDNDRIAFEIESDVTHIPYIPDFGSQNKKGRDVARWTAEDANQDGYTFVARGDNLLDAYSFSYGGGMYGFTTVTLPNSDDRLLSRHISMEGGKTYKMVYNARIGMDGGSLPLDINLYRMNGNERTLVGKIHSAEITSPAYTERIFDFNVAESGIYQLEFAVIDNKAIDYRMYLGGFRLTEKTAVDLSVEEIVLPTRYISGIHSFPVGLRLRNNGSEAVTSLTLTAESASIGVKSTQFSNIDIEPDATYLIYFPEDFVFSGEGSETLAISVKTDGDTFADNDTRTETLTYCEPYSLPFSLLPDEAMERMGTFNLNRDSFRFQSDRTIGVGYMYAAPETAEANDYVATPAVSLRKGDAQRLSFAYYVQEGDATDFEVFAYNAATDIRVPVASLHKADAISLSRYIGFFEVPEDGSYNICIRPLGNTESLFVSASVSIEKAQSLPDIVIGSLASHTAPAVLTDNEKVTVDFTSVAEQGVQGVPFELTVGDKTYHSIYTAYTATNDNDKYSISFNGVDLNEPGDYAVVCRAVVPMDVNPSDNEAAFTITSLPVVDLAVGQLVSPKSGKLGKQEKVTVAITNNGKGAISGFDVKCVVSGAAKTELTGRVDTSLAAGQSMEYTFDNALDMFEEGVYTFTVTVTAEGDINPDDNTLTASVNSTEKDFDSGVSAIIAPEDDALSDAESVTVIVNNYGETDLFDIPVKVEVLYQGADTPAVLTGAVASVKAGETAEYTLPGTVDMKKCGNYTITARTEVAGDSDISNDAATRTVRCLTQDVGVTAIISPVTGVNLGVCDVIVEVTNFGEADVKDIPMSYQIGSMPQMAVMSGVLKSGEKAEFKFPVPYEFTSFRKATVRASTMLENDINPSNDELTAEVENKDSGLDSVTVKAGLWPNPAHSAVKVTADSAITSVSIYDTDGRLRAAFAGNGSASLDIDLGLPAGHYLTVIATASGTTVERLIIL